MTVCSDYGNFAEVRANIYRFLARVYRSEVTEQLLADMKELPLPEAGEGEAFTNGAAELRRFLKRSGIDPRTDLAVDYARVFLGAGVADGSAAYPYESVYTSPEGLMMQDARDDVVALYKNHGLAVESSGDEPEDHLAFELDFMVHLIGEGAACAQELDLEGLASSLGQQRAFLRDHLQNWVGRFCVDVERYSETTFYPAIARMTDGLIAMDSNLIDELIAEVGGAA